MEEIVVITTRSFIVPCPNINVHKFMHADAMVKRAPQNIIEIKGKISSSSNSSIFP